MDRRGPAESTAYGQKTEISGGLPTVLALEVALFGRSAKDIRRDPAPDPGVESGQPAVRRARIYGELLKLGIEVAQSTVAKYMARSGRGRSQTWKTFLRRRGGPA